MHKTKRYLLPVFISLSLLSGALLAQYDNSRGDQPEAEFHMARLIYTPSSNSNRGYWREMWAIDYPAAEYHFTQGVRRLTHVNTAQDSIHLRLSDDRIFDYPCEGIVLRGHPSGGCQ